MRRGESWMAAGGSDDAGQPRPVIVQDDRFEDTRSITICALTTNTAEVSLVRPSIQPSASNGLRADCRLMIDKLATVSRSKLGQRIGRLDDRDLRLLDRAILVFLGLAARGRSEPSAGTESGT